MWNSLKEQIDEVGSARVTGNDASAYIKDSCTVFVYEGHKLLIPISDESEITIRHIGKGTVKLSFRCIDILGRIECP